MNILMVTNVYTPFVGGVALSVKRFTEAYLKMGHKVLVVTPEFEDEPTDEANCARVPAIQNFNGSDFSVAIPIPMYLRSTLNEFKPDIVHSHHPFLLGDTAMRISASREIPLVFTHHTMYEHYTHYVPVDADKLREFVVALCCGYANRCDHVIAPSQSVEQTLRERHVESPISVIPTGVHTADFQAGDGKAFRQEHDIPQDAFVVGHVGRLAEEKNLNFLVRAVSALLKKQPGAFFVVVGSGDLQPEMQQMIEKAGFSDRTRFTGALKGDHLHDAYRAMDVFAFSSKSETQGMVLMEAMAADTPVVALAAPGVLDVVRHEENGFVVDEEDTGAFLKGLEWIAQRDASQYEKIRKACRNTAEGLDMDRCAQRALDIYETLIDKRHHDNSNESPLTEWSALLDRVKAEWQLWANRIDAATNMFEEDKNH